MFRLQDNVPEVYILLSRDFQLVSRLFDTIFSGVKYDIDSLVNILDATKARDTVLQLLCTKVGFFTDELIDAEVLKYIIASFPYIIKYKGTKTGIQYAVNAILKAEHITDDFSEPIVEIVNKSTDSRLRDYTVYIYTTIDVYNRVALKELLKYVLPCGYNYVLSSYSKFRNDLTWPLFKQQDYFAMYKINSILNSLVKKTITDYTEDDILTWSEDTDKARREKAVYDAYGSTSNASEVVSQANIKAISDKIENNQKIQPVTELYNDKPLKLSEE